MSTSTLPATETVRTLPATIDHTVGEDVIDENGHMNITAYFRDAAWVPWLRLGELGVDKDYITGRRLSFFTVQHHIDYLAELRLGQRYSVRAGFAGRTEKALHSVSFVLDEDSDRIACRMEVIYVHVSTETRRSAPIPDDVATAIDADIAAHRWVADAATGLALRR